MKIIVQKFGGTFVTTPQVRALVLKKVQQAQTAGWISTDNCCFCDG